MGSIKTEDKKLTIKDISVTLDAKLVCTDQSGPLTINRAFASDLMSDVLRLDEGDILLITGLANVQTIRTAEMSDIHCIVFARGKKVTPDMIDLAKENNMTLLECRYSVFKTCGLLYKAGIKPVF
ncbi:MAG: hypothetical protein K9I94_12025 [Bacteroidales bacterium]|nr:hypothetical protein [Bacteroidales bacterium]